jgi:hypothetical protein
MAAWFIPALKAILPHVGTIVGAGRLNLSGEKSPVTKLPDKRRSTVSLLGQRLGASA